MSVTEVEAVETVLEDPTEVLEPSVAERVQVIGKEDYEFQFVQKPLSFFGKLDLFSVLGKALTKAMSGDGAVSVGDLLEMPERAGNGMTADDLRDADVFIRSLAKIASYAPEVIGDLYCVILDVPRGQREVVKEVMSLNAADGGLTDADGIAIIKVFVEQNWEVLRDFFKEQIAPLITDLSGQIAPQASQSSKPSKSTRRRTPKAQVS